MRTRLRLKTRVSNRLKARIQAVVALGTFAGLLFSIHFLYTMIGNVSKARAAQEQLLLHPKAGILEGYAGRKKISFPGYAPGTELSVSQLPVPVILRLDELRQTETGGMIFSKDGSDIHFTGADGITPIPFYLERYDPGTGKIVAWVLPDSITIHGIPECYLYFGSIAHQRVNSKDVFKPLKSTVWHFNGSFQTDSERALPGEYRNVKDEEGRFASAKEFAAYSAACVAYEPGEALQFNGNITVSSWILHKGSNEEQMIFNSMSKKGGCALFIDKKGILNFEIRNDKGDVASLRKVDGGREIPANTWTSVSGVFNAEKKTLTTFVNGQPDRVIGTEVHYESGGRAAVGSVAELNNTFFNGIIDELRVSAIAMDNKLVSVLYDAESNPEAFIRSDDREVFSASPRLARISSFEADVRSEHVSVRWTSEEENNLDYYSLERSSDGEHFDKVATRFGQGDNKGLKAYFLIDPAPVFGSAYYRLRFTSFKGESEISHILNVHYEAAPTAIGIKQVEPNPFSDQFSVVYTASNENDILVKLTSISGSILHSETVQPRLDHVNQFHFSKAASLPPGIYFLNFSQDDEQKTVKLVKRS